MLAIYRTVDHLLHRVDEAEKGDWINLTNPTEAEILATAEETGIYEEFSSG